MPAAPQSCVYLVIQTVPLDLYTDSFYENRRDVIEARLQQLHASSSEKLAKLIADIWTTQEGKAAALVSWGRFDSLQQVQVNNYCREQVLCFIRLLTHTQSHGVLTVCAEARSQDWLGGGGNCMGTSAHFLLIPGAVTLF